MIRRVRYALRFKWLLGLRFRLGVRLLRPHWLPLLENYNKNSEDPNLTYTGRNHCTYIAIRHQARHRRRPELVEVLMTEPGPWIYVGHFDQDGVDNARVSALSPPFLNGWTNYRKPSPWLRRLLSWLRAL